MVRTSDLAASRTTWTVVKTESWRQSESEAVTLPSSALSQTAVRFQIFNPKSCFSFKCRCFGPEAIHTFRVRGLMFSCDITSHSCLILGTFSIYYSMIPFLNAALAFAAALWINLASTFHWGWVSLAANLHRGFFSAQRTQADMEDVYLMLCRNKSLSLKMSSRHHFITFDTPAPRFRHWVQSVQEAQLHSGSWDGGGPRPRDPD